MKNRIGLCIIACLCISSVFLLSGCNTLAPNTAVYDGHRMQLGMQRDEIQSFLGEGTEQIGEIGFFRPEVTLYEPGIEIQYAQDDSTVIGIAFTSPDVKTFNGIRVGDNSAVIEKTYDHYRTLLAGYSVYFYEGKDTTLTSNKPDCIVYYNDNDDGIITSIEILYYKWED